VGDLTIKIPKESAQSNQRLAYNNACFPSWFRVEGGNSAAKDLVITGLSIGLG